MPLAAAEGTSALIEHEPRLRAWALRATGDAEASRELVQETLTAAVAGFDRFDGRSSVLTWLLGLLAHKIADHFRRRYRDPFELAASEPADLLSIPTDSEVERVAMARRDLEKVRAAMAHLPRGERLALMLVCVEGLDHAQACHELGVSATNLRVLLHRGRHRLRRTLELDL